MCSGLVGADSKRLAAYAPAEHDSFRNQTFIADQTTCIVTADETIIAESSACIVTADEAFIAEPSACIYSADEAFIAESSACIYAAESDQATFCLTTDQTIFAD